MAGRQRRPPSSDCVRVRDSVAPPQWGQVRPSHRGPIGLTQPVHESRGRRRWGWTRQRRQDFANDPRNLVAVTASVNLAKGDRTPGDWPPPTDAGRCLYGQRYVTVAAACGLPITIRDKAQLLANLQACA